MTTGVDKGSMFTPSALTSTDTEDGQAVGKEYLKITKENVNWTSWLSGNPSKTELLVIFTMSLQKENLYATSYFVKDFQNN